VSWSPHERTGQPARLDPGRARSGPAAGGSSCQSTCGDSDPPAELLRSGRSSRRIAHDRSGFVGYGPDLEIQTRVEHPTNQSRPTFGYARCGESQQSCAPSAPSSRRSSCRSDVCACVSKHAEECEFQVRGTRLRDHTARRRRRHHRLERNRCTLHRVRPSWPHHVRSSLPHSWPRGPTGPIACPRMPRRRPAPVELHCRSGYPGA
jgi:hypothetical protein